jgi:hypothetical protein
MALDYAMGDQIEHLSDLLDQTEQDAEAFFDKNYVTAGMGTLLRQALQRMGGKSDQAVFELKQAMGGGKTHSMLALGVLARNPHLWDRVPPEIADGLDPFKAKVVAINGRTISRETFLWGDIAVQLGKKDHFSAFWKNGADSPGENDWVDLLGDEPTLILLDELPPYFDYALTRPVGGATLANVTTYALSNLLSAALRLKRLCIVVSNLSGTYEGASRELSKAIRDFQQEANRQAKAITPVDLSSNDIYEILKKRLFKKVAPPGVIDSVATSYAAALSEAVKTKAIAKSAEQVAEEIHRSYPFHPAVKHLIALFKENESYRQTRGLMQFVSKLIKSVWERSTNDVYLIGCQHLDLNIADVREEVGRISNLQGAVTTDVASAGESHAEILDSNLGSDAASQVGRLLLVASLSESVDAVKGLNKQQVIECLVAPHRTALEFDGAFEQLRQECWYLHRKENDAWYFSNSENLRKRIENRADTAPQPKIDAELKRRLEETFSARRRVAYQQVIAMPLLDEIKLGGSRVCLVLSPDSKIPPQVAKELFDSVVEKNNFCVVTGDGSSLGNLEDKVRRIWAIAKVKEEVTGRVEYLEELAEEAEIAEFDFNSSLVTLFNRVYFPSKSGLVSAKLQLSPGKGILAGEDAVEQALAAIGASKLETDVQGKVDALIGRAEDMLWQGNEKRIPWRDVAQRTLTNARWTWLPPKGLDQLRDLATGQDRWRYTQDGYIEKGPFPPPRTAVSLSERDPDASTGKATIEVTARDAGPHGRVHFSKTPDVSAASPVVPDTIFVTDDTVLYFLAVDPDGKHDTGEVLPWSNKLIITHQPKTTLGKRTVELTVRPRGTIRWNTTGANPKEGEVYSGPIELAGKDAVTLYVHAEDSGVSATRQFKIPALADGPDPDAEQEIDPDKPAILRKALTYDGNGPAFAAIKAAKDARASFGGTVKIEVGRGSAGVATRFGSDAAISADMVDRLAALAREALENSAAEVKLGFGDMRFATGHDLLTFVRATGLQVSAVEVEQP